MGRYLSPRYDQVGTGQRIPCFESCQSHHGCAISGCTWAPKLLSLTRKYEIKRWFSVVRTDGRRRSVYGQVITEFSGMDRFS